MNADVAPTMAFDTVSLNIPHADLSFLKTLAKRLGWKIHKATKSPLRQQNRKYLNDEPMKR